MPRVTLFHAQWVWKWSFCFLDGFILLMYKSLGKKEIVHRLHQSCLCPFNTSSDQKWVLNPPLSLPPLDPFRHQRLPICLTTLTVFLWRALEQQLLYTGCVTTFVLTRKTAWKLEYVPNYINRPMAEGTTTPPKKDKILRNSGASKCMIKDTFQFILNSTLYCIFLECQ